MPHRFHEKIAADLGLTTAEAESLLSDFLDALHAEVDRSGSAALPGVGTFTRVDGRLNFEPSGELQEAVNLRFADLAPVDAADFGRHAEEPEEGTTTAPPADEDIAVDAPPADPYDEPELEERLAGPDDDAEPVTDPLPDEAAPEDPFADEDEADAEASDALPAGLHDPDGETLPLHDPPPAYPSPDDAKWADAERSSVRSEKDTEPAETEPSSDRGPKPPPPDVPAGRATPIPPSRPPADGSRRTDGRPSRAPVIIAVALLLVVGAVAIAYFMMDQPLGDDAPALDDPIVMSEPEAPADDPAMDDDEAISPEPGADAGAPDPAVEEPAPTEPPAPASPVYGDEIDRTVSRYTLVVASLPSEATAREESQRWQARGIRSDVFAESTPAGTRYRVAIGQFDTIASADSVRSRSDLSSDLPEGTWVYRYPADAAN